MCSLVCPPGDQIYNDEEKKIAMFEVDSIKNPVYIENLGYLHVRHLLKYDRD